MIPIREPRIHLEHAGRDLRHHNCFDRIEQRQLTRDLLPRFTQTVLIGDAEQVAQQLQGARPKAAFEEMVSKLL